MGADSTIEWLGEGGITSSPWEGCTKVHTGCSNCYAEALNGRWRQGANWGKGAPRRVAKGFWTEVPKHARKLAAQGKRGSLFMSICDPLDPEVWSRVGSRDDGKANVSTAARMIETVRAGQQACPDCGSGRHALPGDGGLDWLLLTKRPENAAWIPEDVRRHTWLIYSASDQRSLEMGIDALLRAEGFAGLGLSLEPLVGPVTLRAEWLERRVDWGHFIGPCAHGRDPWTRCKHGCDHRTPAIGWVIIGGESGAGARPYDLTWPRSIIAQCRPAGVPVFHKQVGALPTINYYDAFREEHEPRGLPWEPLDWDVRDGQPPLDSRVRLPIRDKKGGDPSEWPEDLRCRDFPEGLRRA